jgi:hypothetical protein
MVGYSAISLRIMFDTAIGDLSLRIMFDTAIGDLRGEPAAT